MYILYPWRFLITFIVAMLVAMHGLLLGFFVFPLMALVLGRHSVKICRAILYFGFNLAKIVMYFGGVMKLEVDFQIDRKILRKGLVIANHPSLIDYVMLVTEIPNACFLVKESMWRNPWYAGIVRAVGYVRNDDGLQLFNELGTKITNEPVVIFPEGTRSPEGGLHPFYRGAARVACEYNLDIIPVIIECEPRFLGQGRRWYHLPLKKFTYKLSILEVIRLSNLRESESQTKFQLSVKLNNFLSQYYQEKIAHARR